MSTLSLVVSKSDLEVLDKIARQLQTRPDHRKLTRDPDGRGDVVHADPAADKTCGGSHRVLGRVASTVSGFERGGIFVPYFPCCYFCHQPVIWAGWLREHEEALV